MAQFDVSALPDGGWVVDVQADVIALAETTVVIPLLQRDEQPTPIGRLHPLLLVEGDERVLATHLMTVVRRRLLSTPMTSLVRYEYEIKGAIDLLTGGV
jgi:toxin CcdB